MGKTQSSGKCLQCGGVYAKPAMGRHLKTCKTLAGGSHQGEPGWRKAPVLHLRVEAGYDPDYWLHLFAPADATLKALDSFLRDIWLECCGHMSMFTIDGQRYVSGSARELGGKSMSISLSRVLQPGTKCEYEYDFGSTTHLTIKVISAREGEVQGKEIRLLAQNDPYAWQCACGKPATQICTYCMWEEENPFFCDECAEKHECGDEGCLPVVNSPRMGVCGYTGGVW